MVFSVIFYILVNTYIRLTQLICNTSTMPMILGYWDICGWLMCIPCVLGYDKEIQDGGHS